MALRLVSTLTLALALLAACGGAGKQRPDVVLIVVDTLRADRLSAYGYPRPTSPFLEELAREGALFEDVTTQFSWTMPSMVSLFTGRYLTEFMPVVPSDAPTLAECFRRSGYATLGIVSNMLVEPSGGFARGFDHYDVRPSRDPAHAEERTPRSAAEIRADLAPELERALARDARGRRKPLFLYVHTFDPHHPYKEHAAFARTLPAAATQPVEPPGWQAAALAERGPPPADGDWSDALAFLHAERGRYDQEVRYTDEELRALFAELEERGVLEHAVVALVSDHGEGLWEHVRPETPSQPLAEAPPEQFFYQAHGQVQYQEVLHTPFLLWGAGVPHVRVRSAVENVDLAPTLLDLADVAALGPLHGRSLVELMHGRAHGWREHVFSNATRFTSVRELATGLKLVIPQPTARALGHSEQLFDLGADPHERHDLAASRPADVERLKAVHAEWKRRHPTPDYLDKEVRAEDAARRAQLLRELGYTGDETGMDDAGGQ